MLNAGREDIAGHCPWNQALRGASITAIAKAAHGLVKKMRYTWMRYLPSRVQETGFFKGYAAQLHQRLSTEDLLFNCSLSLAKPSNLIYVPESFRELHGPKDPLLLTRDNKHTYLLPEYQEDDLEKLRLLKIKEMKLREFVEGLNHFSRKSTTSFQEKPSEWHSRVAQVLSGNLWRPEISRIVDDMKLIPLRLGKTWVSKNSEDDVFFSGQGVSIPGGLDLNVVDPKVETDEDRSHLFSLLGVERLTSSIVCEQIFALHGNPQCKPNRFSKDDLLSQARYLFLVGSRSKELSSIWLVSEKGDRLRAGDLYADLVCPEDGDSRQTRLSSARRFQKDAPLKFPFLHADFLYPPERHDKWQWRKFLLDHLRVAVAPRLVKPTGEHRDEFSLHDHFDYILRTKTASDWLLLLKTEWRDYSYWLEKDENEGDESRANRSREAIRKRISEFKVKARNEQWHPLSETFLPLENLVKRYHGIVPFLDITDPEHPTWKAALRPFGVGIGDDLQFYLRALGEARAKNVSIETVTELLSQVQARAAENPSQVTAKFKEKPLVCIPAPGSTAVTIWTYPSKCVWKGPKCLRKFPALADVYPQLVQLFCNTLGVKDAEIEVFVKEMKELRLSDHFPYITELFLELEKLIKDDTPEYKLSELQSQAIFPVQETSVATSSFQLVAPNGKMEWFIPDRPYLERSFRGKVPLLVFSSGDVSKLKRLMKMLHIETRKLSNCVKGTARTEGRALPSSEWTNSLRAKANCILR